MDEYLELFLSFLFWFIIGATSWLIIEKIFGLKEEE